MRIYRVKVPYSHGMDAMRLYGHARSKADAGKLARRAKKEGAERATVHAVEVPTRITLEQWVDILDAEGMASGCDDLPLTVGELACVVSDE